MPLIYPNEYCVRICQSNNCIITLTCAKNAVERGHRANKERGGKRETAREVARERLTREERKVEVHRALLSYIVRTYATTSRAANRGLRAEGIPRLPPLRPIPGRATEPCRRTETKSKGWGQSTGPRSRVHPHEETVFSHALLRKYSAHVNRFSLYVCTIYSAPALLTCLLERKMEYPGSTFFILRWKKRRLTGYCYI